MPSLKRRGSPVGRIVLRFALSSMLVFALVGLAITFFRARDVRAREERAATSRAELVANGVVAPVLSGMDLSTPMTGSGYDRVSTVAEQVDAYDPGVARIKVWSLDGTVLFSSDPQQVGTQPGIEDDLAKAIDGNVVSDISSLDAPENTSERLLADKLFETYVPVRSSPGSRVEAVVEIYRDYASIQAEIDRLAGTLTISLAAGLLVLFVLLLPVMVGATRTLRRQNDQLAEQAEQLGTLLEREQETVAELRELDRMKNDFVAAASHELRSPLTSIRGYVHLLRRSAVDPDPTADEAMEAIDRQTSRMIRLVTNLLRGSWIERDSPSTSASTFDVGELVREVTSDFLSERGRIRTDVEPDLGQIRCDRAAIGDVLTNLLDNALKYAPGDTPVTVEAKVSDDVLTVRVRDRGLGIDQGDLPRIFDRFYQSDQSATRAHGGVGLGLHIARGLVEGIHGELGVDSVKGQGSTFWFRVPLVKDPANQLEAMI
jgi:signal transduction histidine kinase